MNLLPLEAGRGGAVIAGTGGPAVAPAACAGLTLGVRPEHITTRLRARRGADVAASSTSAPIRSSRAGSAPRRSPPACRQRRPVARGDADLAHVGAAAHSTFFDGTATRAPRPHRSIETQRSSPERLDHAVSSRRRRMICRAVIRPLAGALSRSARRARPRSRRRRSRSRSTTRSPSAARSPRSSTASPPISRRRIPASRSSRSTPGTLPGLDHQGAHRGEERRRRRSRRSCCRPTCSR